MVRERHRVFVKSGVTAEIGEEVLQRHFGGYGTVTDVYIPKAMPSLTPKGFAYISFDSEESVQRALQEPVHEIEGKQFPVGRAEPRPSERSVWHHEDRFRTRGFDPFVPWTARPPGPAMHGAPAAGPPGAELRPVGLPGLAVPGEVPAYADESPFADMEGYGWVGGPGPIGPGGYSMRRNACRIFVGGVPDVLSEEDLKGHFEKYGKVEDVYFPKEKDSRKRRGFCYVRFDTPKAADAAAARSPRTIGGHEIGEIKIAQPRPEAWGPGEAMEYGLDMEGYPIGYGPRRLGPAFYDMPRGFEGRPPGRYRPY